MSRIFSTKAAAGWEEAYPIGNGRLGAMIFGQTGRERIQLNEDSIWYGAPVDRVNPDALRELSGIRKLILEGRIPEAEKKMGYAMSGIPQSQRPYQTAGDVWIQWEDGISEEACYGRELNLDEGIVFCTCEGEKGAVHREYLASAPDQVIAVHSVSDKQPLSLSLLLSRGKYYDTVKRCKNEAVILMGNCGEGGIRFAIAARITTSGGYVKVEGEHLLVEGAKEITLYLAIETTYYRGEDYAKTAIERVNLAAQKGYERIRREHVVDYRALFGRVKLQLGGSEEKEELLRYTETYFDFGRYLMISGSRPGTLPANLQGIWNDSMEPCWDSKYTININMEMNYWPAEICNLSECHLPLFAHLKRMHARGKEVAEKMYGCRGFVAHHNTDIWADCAPQDICITSTFWVMGAAWLCTHIRTHYEYTGDKKFLREMYPVLKDAAVFFHDYLIWDGKHLVTCPSVSPENTYILPDGVKGHVCAGTAMDSQILKDLLEAYEEASQILGISDADVEKNREIIQKLPGIRIGKHGQIMEWLEDYEEEEPGHRHISQLYALHPSHQITCDGTPKLAEAAERTLERRLHFGGGHTGWSCAWIINLYARLGRGDAAWNNLKKLFEKSTYPNMMDTHPLPWGSVFQIDGNFGATAGIVEMLLQSNRERTILLPALPAEWERGSVSGLVMSGGALVSISWQEGILVSCEVRARNAFNTRFCYGKLAVEIFLEEGETCRLSIENGTFLVQKNR